MTDYSILSWFSTVDMLPNLAWIVPTTARRKKELRHRDMQGMLKMAGRVPMPREI